MEKKYSFKYMLTLMLIASALTCFIMTILFLFLSKYSKNNSGYVNDYATLLDMIDELYIGEYDEDEITASAMKATIESLNDGWSYYLTPEEYAEFLDVSNNRFAGIGVGVITDEASGGMYVEYVYKGSAAELAGIVTGDVIIAIDGEDIQGETVEDMRGRLYRPIGDNVDLTILRPDGNIVTMSVVYDYVFVDPVSSELIDSKTGYIEISNFDHGASQSFISSVDELIEQGTDAFIFDVRENGGGMVLEMTGMLDYLLPEGEIFVAVDKDGVETTTESNPEMIEIKCVVLVDRYSYSAAEYFAATLSEYGFATIVGEQTSGKSRMQTTFRMPGGGALHISTSQYLTKNRVSLHDVGGLKPDYKIVLNDEEFKLLVSGNLEKADDPQIQMALDLLKR